MASSASSVSTILRGELELIGSVEFRVELDGFDGGAAQAERVDADAVGAARHRLDL
jgi:hypothetical protein